MTLTLVEWAMIANALRVCATINTKAPSGDHWREQGERERALAERIEDEQGV